MMKTRTTALLAALLATGGIVSAQTTANETQQRATQGQAEMQQPRQANSGTPHQRPGMHQGMNQQPQGNTGMRNQQSGMQQGMGQQQQGNAGMQHQRPGMQQGMQQGMNQGMNPPQQGSAGMQSQQSSGGQAGMNQAQQGNSGTQSQQSATQGQASSGNQSSGGQDATPGQASGANELEGVTTNAAGAIVPEDTTVSGARGMAFECRPSATDCPVDQSSGSSVTTTDSLPLGSTLEHGSQGATVGESSYPTSPGTGNLGSGSTGAPPGPRPGPALGQGR